MRIQLALVPGGPLLLKDGLPEGYTGKLLPLSRALSLTDSSGTIVIQELFAAGCSIRYHFYRFLRKVILQRNCTATGLYIRIMIEGSYCYRLSGFGKVRLKEKRFAAIYIHQGECLSYYDRNRNYEIVDLYFTEQILLPVLELFPGVIDLDTVKNKVPIQLNIAGNTISRELSGLLENIFMSPYSGTAAEVYTEETMSSILSLIIQQISKQPGPVLKFSEADVQALQQVKEMIEHNYKKHISIPRLARQVGLNEYKLKNGFRHFYKMGIFDCLLMARMKKAKELLLQTDEPAKKIATDVGYRRLPSFVTAFRKCYGQSPGRMRKQRK